MAINSMFSVIYICICILIGYSAPELDIAAFKLTKTCAVATFTKPVNLFKCSLGLDSNTKFDTRMWQPLNGQGDRDDLYDTIWTLEDVFELNSESNAILDMEFIDEHGHTHMLPIKKQNNGLFGIRLPKFGYEFGSSVLDVLKEQLASCKQLLEFEPDSKCMSLTLNFHSNHRIYGFVFDFRDFADGCPADARHRSQTIPR